MSQSCVKLYADHRTGAHRSQELEWVRPVIVFHAAIAVKPIASKMYYT